jgi:hypothetical protein
MHHHYTKKGWKMPGSLEKRKKKVITANKLVMRGRWCQLNQNHTQRGSYNSVGKVIKKILHTINKISAQ